MRTPRMFVLAFAVGVAAGLGACNRDADVRDETAVPPASEAAIDQAVRVTGVELGRAIDAQGRIPDDAETDEFNRNDTVYVSVNTEGSAAGGRLTARWTFEDGQVVDESTQTLSATGPAVTEFHISNPGGFPAGRYKVEIQLNGRTVETEEFTIR
ncbi:MAG TPA: hypothetical protein VK936_10990 [Longimicrobiales bacterium]|nr:hypothetical protein [Longimicrobiales bacterium]